MTYFYVKPEDIRENSFLISGEQAHYLSNVRRFKANAEIIIFDGIGNSYKAKIISINKQAINGIILSAASYKTPAFIIKLYTSIPKGNRFEWLIEKCAEIGVVEIAPIKTKRSIHIDLSKNKFERYKRISISASAQCERSDIMIINNPVDFETACKDTKKNKGFISILPCKNESNSILSTLFLKSKFIGANIFIGPEGGFENEEIKLAKSLGIKPITLGNNILRVETAAVVASVLTLNFQRKLY
jgi:16S rRNA (uracil1498-N3)-methyltransferase